MIPLRKAQEYQEDNKEQILLKHKKYYAENKVDILNRLKETPTGAAHKYYLRARFSALKYHPQTVFSLFLVFLVLFLMNVSWCMSL